MNNVTNSANVRLLTLGLGLVASLGAMSPAYGFSQADLDQLFESNECEFCDLSNANLINADLFLATLNYADLSGADLSGANLIYAEIRDADLSNAKLTGADIIDAVLYGADLRNANLIGADLRKTNLGFTLLYGANFTGANLTGANFNYAYGFVQPTSTSLGKISVAAVLPDAPNFTDANLEGVIAKNALLPNANFTGTSLKGSKFSGTDLQGGDFTGADLTDGIFNNVNFLGTNLTTAQLASAKSLRGSTLPDGTVIAATPEPSTLFGFGAMIALGVGSTLKRKIQ